MGVLGLWRLIDAAGKPVPLESLEGKVLAIDVSIWIHQVVQGYQDRKGSLLPNAHLIGLFNRICKLMYYKIKPVFVFDGGVPLLKKNTIAFRRKQKSMAASKAQKLKNELINNLIKHTAVKTILDDDIESSTSQLAASLVSGHNQAVATKHDEMFKLPEMPIMEEVLLDEEDYDSYDSEEEVSPRKQTKWAGNIHNVDVDNEDFKNLPPDVRYDILTDLKETRKQNSWGRLHEMPKESQGFSDFQMKRLMKRRQVQEYLEVAENEMDGKSLTLEELEKLMTEQGIAVRDNDDAFRIASDAVTRVIYVNDKNALLQKLSPEKDHNKNGTDSNESIEDIKNTERLDKNEIIKETSDKEEKEVTKENNNSEETNSAENSMCTQSTDHTENIKPFASTSSEDNGKTIEEVEAKPSTSKDEFQGPSIIDDINEYDFQSDSDNDFVEVEVTSKPNLKNTNSAMNPAIGYMLEYSNLPQDQILALTQQTQKLQSKSKSDLAKCLKQYADISDSSNSDDLFEMVKSSQQGSKNKIVEVVSDIYTTTSPICDDKFWTRNDKIEEKEIIISSSESDSDDFIAVEDDPTPKKELEKIEIRVNPHEKLEDDLFADVFNDVFAARIENNTTKFEAGKEIASNEIITAGKREDQDNGGEMKNVEITTSVDVKDNRVQLTMKKIDGKEIDDEIYINSDKEIDRTSGNLEAGSEEIELVQNSSEQIERNVNDVLMEVDSKGSSRQIEERAEVNNSDLSRDEKVSKPEPIVPSLDEKELQCMKNQLEEEQKKLNANIGKLDRQGTDITEQMSTEAQELLRLFGIPYVVAPLEAEAQCAFFEINQLTNGTITDDSDIWLFGGRCVYKNFFDNNKNVLQFLVEDIQHHYKLTRQQMIQLAILVGSDYTTGVQGIGPVTALEILASFPSDGEDILRGLVKFASWMRTGKSLSPSRGTLRNKLKNVSIDKGFPSQAVAQAYLYPIVDDSKEPFTWGKPNLTLIGDFVRKKFGWSQLKFEEIMKPVMKKFLDTTSQKTLLSYYKIRAMPKSIEKTMSKRVQSAVQKLSFDQVGGEENENEIEETNTVEKTQKKKSTKRKKKGAQEGNPTEEPESQNINDEQKETIDQGEKEVPKKVVKLKSGTDVSEVIPQRELDKSNALKNKLKAIEIFRKSKKGLGKTRKVQKKTKILEDAHLSESEDSS